MSAIFEPETTPRPCCRCSSIRGDALALVRWHAVSGSGREWESFHLTRWNTDGQNVLNIIFPPDQLIEALAELDSLYQESLGDPAEATKLESGCD